MGIKNSLGGTPAVARVEEALECFHTHQDIKTAIAQRWQNVIAQTSSQLKTWRSGSQEIIQSVHIYIQHLGCYIFHLHILR
jgi:cobalamin biosynthesis Co2+ chelatase CbiK